MREKTKNKIVIGASFGFSDINCIVAQMVVRNSNPDAAGPLLGLGITMAVMTPLSSLWEIRPKMLTDSAVWTGILTRVLLDIMLSCFDNCWWLLLLSAVETIISIWFFKLYRRRKQNIRKTRKK